MLSQSYKIFFKHTTHKHSRIHFMSPLSFSSHPVISLSLHIAEKHLKPSTLLKLSSGYQRTMDAPYRRQLTNIKTDRDAGSWRQSSVVLCLPSACEAPGSQHQSQGKEMGSYLATEKQHIKNIKEGNWGPGKTF